MPNACPENSAILKRSGRAVTFSYYTILTVAVNLGPVLWCEHQTVTAHELWMPSFKVAAVHEIEQGSLEGEVLKFLTLLWEWRTHSLLCPLQEDGTTGRLRF